MLRKIISSIGRKNPNFRKLLNPLAKLAEFLNKTDKIQKLKINNFHYNLNLQDYLQSQMYYFGIFDKKGVDLIVKICRAIECRSALDIGANVGNHGIFLSDACHKVFSFEPNDTPGNVYKNALTKTESNIVLFDIGLSDVNEKIEFYENKENLGGSSFIKEHLGSKKYNKKKLEVRIGDEFIQEKSINEIDFIKIDVEGFEISVLNGLKKTIEKHNPVIDFEFNAITRLAFANEDLLHKKLDGYILYGTQRAGFGLTKEKLSIVNFNFNKDYAHVIAVPNKFMDKFSSIL